MRTACGAVFSGLPPFPPSLSDYGVSIDMATGASQVRLLDDVSIEDHLRAEDRRVYLLGLFALRNRVGGCQQSGPRKLMMNWVSERKVNPKLQMESPLATAKVCRRPSQSNTRHEILQNTILSVDTGFTKLEDRRPGKIVLTNESQFLMQHSDGRKCIHGSGW